MKLYFEDAIKVSEGLALVADELGIALTAKADAEVCVRVREQETDGFHVSLHGACAQIVFGGGLSRFFRALSYLAAWVREGRDGEVSEKPLFLRNGAMLDMSRNAVMNVKTVKYMLRKMALMGMSTCMLYTEDVYEVDDYPYFGHLRGRYTKEEIKELDAYALSLGIELIPCIQVLGHLETALRWGAATPYRDASNVLLVGADETYALIDAMLKSVSECFTTRRIHIGMDETHALGTGRYLDKYGYRPRHEIFLEHLRRVVELVKKHGLSPMMWSDMFFRLSANGMEGFEEYDVRTVLSEEILHLVPEGVTQVFWDYYHTQESFYAKNIENHRLLGEDTVFAGGVWLWSGSLPLFSHSLGNTVPALDACRKGGVREVLATVWTNSAECPAVISLAGLAWYADYDYTGGYDAQRVSECFARATGECYEDCMRLDRGAYPHGGKYCMTTALTYSDPLLGFVDRHIEGIDTKRFYETELEALAGCGGGMLAPVFEMVRRVLDLLSNKADFGVRIRAAYKNGDRETLIALSRECDVIMEKIEALRLSHRAAWMAYHKVEGFEVLDIRLGGLRARFDTVRERIEAYLAGDTDALALLSQKPLRLDCDGNATERDCEMFHWYGYRTVSTAGVL